MQIATGLFALTPVSGYVLEPVSEYILVSVSGYVLAFPVRTDT